MSSFLTNLIIFLILFFKTKVHSMHALNAVSHDFFQVFHTWNICRKMMSTTFNSYLACTFVPIYCFPFLSLYS